MEHDVPARASSPQQDSDLKPLIIDSRYIGEHGVDPREFEQIRCIIFRGLSKKFSLYAFWWLEEITIVNCDLPALDTNAFPNLKKLIIQDCEKLVVVILAGEFIVEICLWTCPALRHVIFGDLPALEILNIQYCRAITQLPDMTFDKLRELLICFVGVQSITTYAPLEFLRVASCPNLLSIVANTAEMCKLWIIDNPLLSSLPACVNAIATIEDCPSLNID